MALMTYGLGGRVVLCSLQYTDYAGLPPSTSSTTDTGPLVQWLSRVIGIGSHNPRRFDSSRTCCTAALHSASEMAKSIRPAVLAKVADAFSAGRPAVVSHMPNFRMQPSAARVARFGG